MEYQKPKWHQSIPMPGLSGTDQSNQGLPGPKWMGVTNRVLLNCVIFLKM